MSALNPFFKSIQLTELTLRVRDLARVGAFYQDVLGLRLVIESESRVSLFASGQGPALMVLEHTPSAPAHVKGTAGLFHVALLYPSRAALGRAARTLIEKNVGFGTGDHGVSEALYLDDPEGNGVELYADRATRDWPAAQADGEVVMYTEAVEMESLLAAGSSELGPLMPAETRIGHIHLSVSDLEKAKAFYVDVLGFPIRQSGFPGTLFIGRDGYHHHFGANVWRSRSPAVAGALGLARFTVRFSNKDELTKVIARAEAQGLLVARDPERAQLHDLDGLEVVLRSG
jgi:catechol 2,3-dioxygenase